MAKHIKVLGKTLSDILSDETSLNLMVEDIIQNIGMRPLAEPLSVNVPLAIEKLGQEPFEDEGGISVIRLLSTSHIAIHTWPLRNEFHLDIYSCREFNTEMAMQILEKHIALEQQKVFDCSFGCEW